MTINKIEGKVNNIEFIRSPNVGGTLEPDSIVIHYTAQTSTDGAVRSLTDPLRKVSAHFVIGRDGKLIQLVPMNKQAWHAGQSTWNGRSGYNKYSIGIEIVNAGLLNQDENNGFLTWYKGKIPNDQVESTYDETTHDLKYWHSYSKEQIDTCWNICNALIETYNIKEILGHEEISPGRKTDPGPAFPLNKFRERLMGNRDQDEGLIEEEKKYKVSVSDGDFLNLRKRDINSSILAKLANNTEVTVLHTHGDMVKISLEGYVSKRYTWFFH